MLVLPSDGFSSGRNHKDVVQQAHFIVDEMLMNGSIVETNKQNILAPIQLLEKAS